MKKITFKNLLTLIGVLFVFNANAQQTKKSQLLSTPIQLTADSQRSLDETGFVRCASIEMDQQRKQRESHIQTDQQFEEWLAPLLQARKAEIAQQKANGSFRMVVVNIPIIFHVISSGGASNLSQAQVQAQIDQLNIDFSNGAGSVHAAAADAQVVFLPAQVDPSGNPLTEAGINRVTTYGSGPFPTSDFDVGGGGLDIKSTGWDYSQYANIWTADITGGILGYAQFPSNSTLPGMAANGGTIINSGVVVGYGTVGSVAMPGSAAPYNLGRTLTHEVGHWIGLRHIWGDNTNCNGGATEGDFCADTPEASESNFGCPTVDSCTADGLGNDMVENYMDYSDDACMDIFTADQVLRIETVLINADGLSDLSNSTTATLGPVIAFSNATQLINEVTDCNYTDISIPVSIGDIPSAAADVTVSVTGGTATVADYLIMGTALNFPLASSADQNFTLRIYNDSFVEGDKTITLGLALNANGGDATLTTAPTLANTITITSDDIVPSSTYSVTHFYDDFEDLDVTDWTFTDSDGDTNFFGDQLSIGAVTPTASLISRSWITNPLTPDNWAVSSAVDLSTATGAITLEWKVQAAAAAWDQEEYSVYVSTSNAIGTLVGSATTFNEIYNDPADTGSSYTRTLDLSAHAGQTVYLAFRHWNCTDQDWLSIDDVNVTSMAATNVQTVVNAAQDDLLTSAGQIYTSDAASGDVMADVNNNNGVDYGCISTNVSRASGAAQVYQVAGAANFVMDKTFAITPTTVQAGGDATLKFYFTEIEIIAWEGVTGNNRSSLVVIKDNGTPEPMTTSISSFGTNVTLEASFVSGIEGTYYFGKLSALKVEKSDFTLFSIYPNPTNGIVSISLSSIEDVQVSLYDIRGRLISSESHTNNSGTFRKELNFGTVSSGVYLLNVKSGNKTATKKLIIQ